MMEPESPALSQGLPRSFLALRQVPGQQADACLSAALQEADPGVLRAALAEVFAAPRPEYYRPVVSRYLQFPRPLRQRIAEHLPQMWPEVSALAYRDSVSLLRNLLALLLQNPRPEAAGIAARLMKSAETDLRRDAGKLLVEVVKAWLRSPDRKPGDREPVTRDGTVKHGAARDGAPQDGVAKAAEPRTREDHVYQALVQGLADFPDHFELGAVEASLIFGEQTVWLVQGLLQRPSAFTDPRFAGMLQLLRSTAYFSASLLFRLLADRNIAVRNFGLEMLSTGNSPAFYHAVGDFINRRKPPELAENLKYLPGATLRKALGRLAQAAGHLDPGAQQVLVNALFLLAMPGPEAWEWAVPSYPGLHPHTQELFVDRALAAPGFPTREFLRALLPVAEEAGLAPLLRLLAQACPESRLELLSPLLASDRAHLRNLAVRELATDSVNRYLSMFEHLDARTREQAALAISRLDDHFVARMSDDLLSLEKERRLRALQIISYANHQKELEENLYHLVQDPDSEVRATLVKVLGAVGTIGAIKALLGLLPDRDDRVKANVIEVLENLRHPRLRGLLFPFLRHPNNRVRGNAAKTLLSLGYQEAGVTVLRMLRDADPKMVGSALWVLERFPLPEALPWLQKMSRQDLDNPLLLRLRKTMWVYDQKAAGSGPGSG